MTHLPAPIRRLMRYGTTGIGVNVTAYLLFLGLIGWANMSPILASGLCYAVAGGTSYLINRRWTFASTQSHRRDLPRFAVAYGVGLVVTLASMAVLVELLGAAVAQLVTICIAALSIYTALILFGFGGGDKQPMTHAD